MFMHLFRKKLKDTKSTESTGTPKDIKQKTNQVAVRKGELGEYKIDIQLDQLPRDYKYISDVMLKNPKSISGFSQIDHVVISPFGIFVIETKNYQGTIYGAKERKEWSVNGKFKMMNPFAQNYGHIQVLNDLLNKKYQDHFISLVSFTKRCTFKVDIDMRKITSNELIIYDIELTEFINRKVSVLKIQLKNPVISEEEIKAIYSAIQKANITDPAQRESHTRAIVKNKERKEKDVNDEKRQQCITCKQPVTEKVASFCLSNKKFEGKIYCFTHQKDF